MMWTEPVLIMKTGRTLDALAPGRGDYEDWIRAGMELPPERVRVADVQRGGVLPECDEIAGVVITGSHDMVTDRHHWSEYAAGWLAGAVSAGLPVLGICYGHQLLAHALGGRVSDLPGGMEAGTVEITLNEAGRQDPLFSGLDGSFPMHVIHSQRVEVLPPGAVLLASSRRDPHQAFRMGRYAWGVQFHPEFDEEVMREYLRHCQRPPAAAGICPGGGEARCAAAPAGPEILRRFARLVHAPA